MPNKEKPDHPWMGSKYTPPAGSENRVVTIHANDEEHIFNFNDNSGGKTLPENIGEAATRALLTERAASAETPADEEVEETVS